MNYFKSNQKNNNADVSFQEEPQLKRQLFLPVK